MTNSVLPSRPTSPLRKSGFRLVIAARYEPAYAALENLLTRVGRRRLIVSPYRDLAATPEGKVRAREIFANAREGYHPIRAFLLSAFRFSAFRFPLFPLVSLLV